MGSNYTYSATSRIPVRPLSYDNVYLAQPKELVIDYKNAKMYICDLNGKIIDITNKILNQTETMVLSTLNSEDGINTIKNINIVLDDGTTVSIESAIVQLFSQLSNMEKNIENTIDIKVGEKVEQKTQEIKKTIPTASTMNPLANEENGSIGTKTNSYSLADHVHPKGKASVADEALSIKWENVKNIPTNISNPDSVYYKKSGGDINGDIIMLNGKGLYGYTTDKSRAMISYIDSENRIHIGDKNSNPIILDATIILNSSNYGEDEPSNDNAVTGQVYFQLV